MSSIFGEIGKLFSGLSGAQKFLLPLTAFSGISDIMRGHQQQSLVNEMEKRAKYAESLTPAQLTAMAERTAAPLSTGLIENVGNLVQGQMAERGLAQAPGIYTAELGARLAPFEQANLDAAYQAVLQQLYAPIAGLGSALRGSQGMGSDFGSILKAMLGAGKSGGPTTGIDLSQLGSLFPGIYGGGGTIWNAPEPTDPIFAGFGG